MHGLTIEIYRRRRLLGKQLWDWRIVASNGQIVATDGGQGFTERNDAKESVVGLLNRTDIPVSYV